MKYPQINKQARREVNLPELSGGMNLRESVSMIRDNQLTDSCNMWFRDGILKTRPSLSRAFKSEITLGTDTDFRVHDGIIRNGATLISYSYLSESYQYVQFWFGDGNELPEIKLKTDNNCKYFIAQHNGTLYLYFDNFTIYKYSEGATVWALIGEDEITAPVVMAHCKTTEHSNSFSGTQINGYNLIGRYYKMIYSTINPEDDEHHMWYPLMWSLPSGSCTVKAKLTTRWGKEVEHKVTWGGDAEQIYCETINPGDDFYMFVGHNFIAFSATSGSKEWVKYYDDATENWDNSVKYNLMTDNLEITAPYKTADADKQKIFNMTQNMWFGGAAAGISGGTRLFLCGNTSENEKSLVAWSAVNDPLYFPENNYFYVGDKEEQVTAFGKQGENLIIFKPRETYYTYYVQNSDISADNLISQSVVDLQANSVYFPLITLNSKIGCALADTVKLCRNRLVWFSEGKVYALTSSNQYSEMTIYPVSEMIERRLIAEDFAANQVSAADYNGYYILFVSDKAYAMDYNCYGFTHIYSYSKTEDANALIPWYYWDFELNEKVENLCFCESGNKIYCSYLISVDESPVAICGLVISSSGAGDEYYALSDGEVSDNEKEITSFCQTKMFDFSAQNYLKAVDRVSLMLGNNGGEPVTVTLITDCGTEEETLSLNDDSITPYTPEYVSVQNIAPCIRNIRVFGVRLESKGLLAVDGINLLYRLLGGAK